MRLSIRVSISPTTLTLRAIVELRTQIMKFGGLFSSSQKSLSEVPRRFHRRSSSIFPRPHRSRRCHLLCRQSRYRLSRRVVLSNPVDHLVGARSCRRSTQPKFGCFLGRPMQMQAHIKCRLLRIQSTSLPSPSKRMSPSSPRTAMGLLLQLRPSRKADHRNRRRVRLFQRRRAVGWTLGM